MRSHCSLRLCNLRWLCNPLLLLNQLQSLCLNWKGSPCKPQSMSSYLCICLRCMQQRSSRFRCTPHLPCNLSLLLNQCQSLCPNWKGSPCKPQQMASSLYTFRKSTQRRSSRSRCILREQHSRSAPQRTQGCRCWKGMPGNLLLTWMQVQCCKCRFRTASMTACL